MVLHLGSSVLPRAFGDLTVIPNDLGLFQKPEINLLIATSSFSGRCLMRPTQLEKDGT